MTQYAGLTKLQAVNELLAAITEQPATSLDTDGTSIQARAEAKLDKISTEVQEEGWNCNTYLETLEPSADPFGWWRPQETTSATNQNSDNGDALTYSGGTSTTTSTPLTIGGITTNHAMVFDGVDGKASGDTDGIAYGDGVTVECFIKTSTTGFQPIIFAVAKGESSPQFLFYIDAADQLAFRILDDASLVFDAVAKDHDALSDGEWHHVAVRWNTATDDIDLFIDAEPLRVLVLTTTARPSTAIANSDDEATVTVGNFSTLWLTGSVDEPAIFTSAISDAEIWQHAKYGIEISADRIYVGGNTLSITSAEKDNDRILAIRENVLYDEFNETYVFSSNIRCEIIREIEFVRLTSSLKTAITQQAALEFQTDILGSAKVDAFLRDKAREAMRAAKNKRPQRNKINILDNTWARARPTRRVVRQYLGEF